MRNRALARARARRKQAKTRKAVTPLTRVDPSRTGTLVRAMGAEAARRISRVALEVYDLVGRDDAFGLAPPAYNEYNPSQPRAADGRFGTVAGRHGATGDTKTYDPRRKRTLGREHTDEGVELKKAKLLDHDGNRDALAWHDGMTMVGRNAPSGALPPGSRPDGLSDLERGALQKYSYKNDRPLNGMLRGREGWDAGTPYNRGFYEEMHAQLQAAFAKAPVLAKPVRVVRGMKIDDPAALDKFVRGVAKAHESGMAVQLDGYTSTTTGQGVLAKLGLAPGIPKAFRGNVTMKINAVHGIDMGPHSRLPGEAELLLNHGSRFKVRSVVKKKDGYHVELDQLPPHDATPAVANVGVPDEADEPTPADAPSPQEGPGDEERVIGSDPHVLEKWLGDDGGGLSVVEPDRTPTDDEKDEPAGNAGGDFWDEVFPDDDPLANQFCPTGEGGGVDPSCGPGGHATAKDGPAPKVVKANDSTFTTEFHVGGKRYSFDAMRVPGKEDGWSIIFSLHRGPHDRVGTTRQVKGHSAADAMGVFRQVGRSLDLFLGRQKPAEFEFSAAGDEPSRVKLYDRLSTALAERHGYKMTRTHYDDGPDPYVAYDYSRVTANADQPRDERGRWVATMYHTTAGWNEAAIRKEGFKVSSGTFGEGVYLSTRHDPKAATGTHAGDAKTLKVAASVTNPLEFDLRGPPSEWGKQAGYVRWQQITGGDVGPKGRQALLDAGHDAVSVKFGVDTEYRLVLDPKKLRVLDEDVTNAGQYAFATSEEKLAQFQSWLDGRLKTVAGVKGASPWDRYVELAWSKGARQGHYDVTRGRKAAPFGSPLDDTDPQAAVRRLLLKPARAEGLKLLAGRTFNEMEGMTQESGRKLTRLLADGLAAGHAPATVARAMVEELGMDKARARRIAQTELVRANAEGQLAAMEDLGVEQVGAAVEWDVSSKNVCPLCRPMDGVILSVQEARGMIPRHPNCRCAWRPAPTLAEDSKYTRRQVKRAIADASKSGDYWGTRLDKTRPQLLEEFESSFNAFCPTGPGGGVDPSCGPGGGPKLPPAPTFVSSNKTNVEANTKAVAELRALAVKGDHAGLAAHPGTASPKVQEHKQALLKAVQAHQASAKAPAPAPQASPQASAAAPKAGGGTKGAVPDVTAALGHVTATTGYTKGQLAAGLGTDLVMRARVAGALLQGGAVENAVHHVKTGDPDHVKKITKGDAANTLAQLADTPRYDLAILKGIDVKDTPLQGQAVAYMGQMRMAFGSTSKPGDWRHELGHLVRAALGGASHQGKTEMTKAIAAEYEAVTARVAKNPEGLKTKQPHEWYEKEYGVAGRRSLDNWEENFAEHYRLYHRELYRDKHEGGGGKHLAGYRERHPGMAKIFDAHYTAGLIAEALA